MTTVWIDPDEEPAGGRPQVDEYCRHCGGLRPVLAPSPSRATGTFYGAEYHSLSGTAKERVDAYLSALFAGHGEGVNCEEDEGQSTSGPSAPLARASFLARSRRLLSRLGRPSRHGFGLLREQVADGRRQPRGGLRDRAGMGALGGTARSTRGLDGRHGERSRGTRAVARSRLRGLVRGLWRAVHVAGAVRVDPEVWWTE